MEPEQDAEEMNLTRGFEGAWVGHGTRGSVGGGGWPGSRGEANTEMAPGYQPGMNCGMVTDERGG